MRRCLLALSCAVLLAAPIAAADQPSKAAVDKSPAELREEVLLRERLIAQRYKDFEQSLLRIAQRLERSPKAEDRERAALVRQALEAASKTGIDTRLDRLVNLLKDSKANNLAEVKDAIDQGERLAQDLRQILDLLVKGTDAEQSRALQKRLAELIKMLEAQIRAQRIVRVHTEKESLEREELGQAQDKATTGTGQFAKEMEDKDKPGTDRIPGKDLVRAAIKDQQVAGRHIADANKNGASDSQSAAIDKLVRVRDALDKLLQQLREEERKAILAGLQARVELMLAMQTAVRDGTVQLDKAVRGNEDAKPNRADAQKSLALGDREAKIVAEADAAIRMIELEGSAVAFAEVFKQLRDDMKTVENRLNKADVGPVTQGIEQDIMDTLKEMLGHLVAAQQPPPANPSPNPNPNPGPAPDGRLVEPLAELKMVRSMQLKVNQRTEAYGKRFDGEQPEDAETREELRKLGERQQKIAEVTKNLTLEMMRRQRPQYQAMVELYFRK